MGSLRKPTTRSFLGEEGAEWMTVGAVVRREGMVVVVFFKMERSLGAVVVWLPGMYGMVAMKSLPGRVTQG
jgi:hypothetical protein